MSEIHIPAAIRPLLLRAGLELREVEVYLALLALKQAPASNIAKHAKQQRSNTYIYLESLKQKGLIAEVKRKKIIHFIAESPTRLLTYIEQKEVEMKQVHSLLEDSMPVLTSLTSVLTDKPRVTLETGVDAMKQVYKDILHYEFVGAFNVENVNKVFSNTIAVSLLSPNIQLKGRELVVANTAGIEYIAKQDSPNLQSKLLPASTNFFGDILIFNKTIVLFAYDTDYTIVKIENANMADLLQSWFELLWQNT